MKAVFCRTFYDTFKVLGHPALGGLPVFTLIGIVSDIPGSTLAIAFVIYSIWWVIMCDYLKYIGWDRM